MVSQEDQITAFVVKTLTPELWRWFWNENRLSLIGATQECMQWTGWVRAEFFEPVWEIYPREGFFDSLVGQQAFKT